MSHDLPTGTTPIEDLPALAASLTEGEPDRIANLANVASLLFWNLDRVNWAGFYLLRGDTLVLGPFHGRPACVRIAVGRGVCGTAVSARATQRVADVHAFPGHIACDAASRSEIVIPMIRPDGSIEGVLDIDSPVADRFSGEDQRALERLVDDLMRAGARHAQPVTPPLFTAR